MGRLVEDQRFNTVLTPANPAAFTGTGSIGTAQVGNVVVTCPLDRQWVIRGAKALFTATASAGSRTPVWKIVSPAGDDVVFAAVGPVTAGQAKKIYQAAVALSFTNAVVPPGGSFVIQIGDDTPGVSTPGPALVGDQFSHIVVFVEEQLLA